MAVLIVLAEDESCVYEHCYTGIVMNRHATKKAGRQHMGKTTLQERLKTRVRETSLPELSEDSPNRISTLNVVQIKLQVFKLAFRMHVCSHVCTHSQMPP